MPRKPDVHFDDGFGAVWVRGHGREDPPPTEPAGGNAGQNDRSIGLPRPGSIRGVLFSLSL
jgi:hypothetical protein